MEAKKIKTLLQAVVNKNSPKIIRYAQLRNGILRATDLDKEIIIDTGTTLDGFLDVSLFSKTLSLENSLNSDSTLSDADFPLPFEVGYFSECERYELDPELFNQDYSSYIPYCRKDKTHYAQHDRYTCLQGINFDPQTGICATNGHVMKHENPSAEIAVPFIIHNESVKVLMHLTDCKTASIYSKEGGCEYLAISGEGYAFSTKLLERPYPDWKACVPSKKACKEIVMSFSVVQELTAAINTLLPFTNPKTHLIKLSGNEVQAFNRDLEKDVRVRCSQDITPFKIGFDAQLFLQILSEINADVTFYFLSAAGACTIQEQNRTLLIMPLLIIEDIDAEEGAETEPAYKPEYLEPAAPKKKTVSKKLDKVTEKLVLDLQEKYGKKAVTDHLQAMELIG